MNERKERIGDALADAIEELLAEIAGPVPVPSPEPQPEEEPGAPPRKIRRRVPWTPERRDRMQAIWAAKRKAKAPPEEPPEEPEDRGGADGDDEIPIHYRARFHRVLYAAIVARTIQETTDRRDAQRLRGVQPETWRKLESYRWLMGDRGSGLNFEDICDALGWNAYAISRRLAQPDRLHGSWSLPRDVVLGLNAYHSYEQDEEDVVHGTPGLSPVYEGDPIRTARAAISEMAWAYQNTGPVRTLSDMSEEEKLAICRRYEERGVPTAIEPRFLW